MQFAARFLRMILLLALAAAPLHAQGLQVNVEEVRRLSGEIADLRDAYQAQQRKISALEREVSALRTALRESNERQTTKLAEFITREDLKRVVEQLKDVDEKRESDKKVILEEISKLGKVLATPPPAPPRRKEVERPRSEPGKEETVISYKVRKGDFLSVIVNDYNVTLKEKGLPRITMEDVKRVNPKININRLYEGQEIFLPVPEGKN